MLGLPTEACAELPIAGTQLGECDRSEGCSNATKFYNELDWHFLRIICLRFRFNTKRLRSSLSKKRPALMTGRKDKNNDDAATLA